MSVVLRQLPQSTIDRVNGLIEQGQPYQILSLGGGVQSSALWLMNMMGMIQPRAEFAVFADTMWERGGTYEYLDYLDSQAEKFGFPPVMRVSAGNIRDDMLDDGDACHQHMPFYTQSGSKRGGMLNRQCTGIYKISVIKREVRRIFGMKKRVQWIGFSMDELSRRNDTTFPKYIKPRYPLLDLRWDRERVKKWFKANGHPIPVKSSCVGCPFRSNREWLEMQQANPEEFKDAVDFDNSVRPMHFFRPRVKKMQLSLFPEQEQEPTFELYIHRSVSPLETARLKSKDDETDEIECGGGCHI